MFIKINKRVADAGPACNQNLSLQNFNADGFVNYSLSAIVKQIIPAARLRQFIRGSFSESGSSSGLVKILKKAVAVISKEVKIDGAGLHNTFHLKFYFFDYTIPADNKFYFFPGNLQSKFKLVEILGKVFVDR